MKYQSCFSQKTIRPLSFLKTRLKLNADAAIEGVDVITPYAFQIVPGQAVIFFQMTDHRFDPCSSLEPLFSFPLPVGCFCLLIIRGDYLGCDHPVYPPVSPIYDSHTWPSPCQPLYLIDGRRKRLAIIDVFLKISFTITLVLVHPMLVLHPYSYFLYSFPLLIHCT